MKKTLPPAHDDGDTVMGAVAGAEKTCPQGLKPQDFCKVSVGAEAATP